MSLTSDKLEWTIASLGFIYPEIVLSAGLLLLIIIGLISKNGNVARILSLIILVCGVFCLLLDEPHTQSLGLFGGMLRSDEFSFYLRGLMGITGILVVILSHSGSIIKNPFEYFTLLLSIVLGAQLLVMSQHFAMVILSLELMSIPAYVLAGYAFDKQSAEASMKYFIYGSVATALMIFGITWIYGLSSTLVFSSLEFSKLLKSNNELFLGAGMLVITGLLFKMAATPFHFWAPDVYQSTPMPVLALFSTIPKIAAGALLIKIISAFSLNGGTRYDWQSIIAIIAIITLTAGNFSALWQKNTKRLMAYSSIGQAGFLLIAIATMSTNGTRFFLFYSSILVISTTLAFLTLEFFECHYQTKNITDFLGLGRIKPDMAVLLTIGMISLTGLPITAGFTAKLFIFSGLLEAWSTSGKDVMIWLFAFGLLNTVISLYYYLRIPYYMFLKEPLTEQTAPEKSNMTIVIGSILALALLWFFFQPNSLMG